MTFKRLLMVLLAVLAWTATIELSLHLANVRLDGSLYIHDDVRRFRFRSGAGAWRTAEGETFVRINRGGFRDRDRIPGPHPGVFRIAVVGDSIVAGGSVTQKETFTQVAEDSLQRLVPAAKIEVLNFGTPNYNLAQQYLTLRDEIFAYQPDLVVEAVSLTNAILNSTRETCVNDSPYPYFVERHGALNLYDPPQPKYMNDRVESALLDVENHVDLALLFLKAQRSLTGIVGNLQQRAHIKPPLPDLFYDRSLFPPRDEAVATAWRISERTITLMRDLCASHRVPFWMITMDVSQQSDPDLGRREEFRARLGTPDLYYADARLIRFAERQNIPHQQMAPLLADYALRTGKYLHGFFNTPPNHGHLNAEGNRVLGEAFAAEIASRAPAGQTSARIR